MTKNKVKKASFKKRNASLVAIMAVAVLGSVYFFNNQVSADSSSTCTQTPKLIKSAEMSVNFTDRDKKVETISLENLITKSVATNGANVIANTASMTVANAQMMEQLSNAGYFRVAYKGKICKGPTATTSGGCEKTDKTYTQSLAGTGGKIKLNMYSLNTVCYTDSSKSKVKTKYTKYYVGKDTKDGVFFIHWAMFQYNSNKDKPRWMVMTSVNTLQALSSDETKATAKFSKLTSTAQKVSYSSKRMLELYKTLGTNTADSN